jgi:hypothetical protein
MCWEAEIARASLLGAASNPKANRAASYRHWLTAADNQLSKL